VVARTWQVVAVLLLTTQSKVGWMKVVNIILPSTSSSLMEFGSSVGYDYTANFLQPAAGHFSQVGRYAFSGVVANTLCNRLCGKRLYCWGALQPVVLRAQFSLRYALTVPDKGQLLTVVLRLLPFSLCADTFLRGTLLGVSCSSR
jgi:hypothetical protein